MGVPIREPLGNEPVPFETIYGALRVRARQYLRHEQSAYSMSATVLVHEAWLALARSRVMRVNDRDHYVKLLSRVMKNLLIDHARQKRAVTNGAGMTQVDRQDSVLLASTADCATVLGVAAALKKLEARSSGLAYLVELRYFSGFTERETAQILGITVRTVRRRWRIARARLIEAMEPTEPRESMVAA